MGTHGKREEAPVIGRKVYRHLHLLAGAVAGRQCPRRKLPTGLVRLDRRTVLVAANRAPAPVGGVVLDAKAAAVGAALVIVDRQPTLWPRLANVLPGWWGQPDHVTLHEASKPDDLQQARRSSLHVVLSSCTIPRVSLPD